MILSLFLIFIKIGFLGFGGGYAMLSLIFDDMQTLGMTVSDYADLTALDMLIPGPIAINSATYVGQLTAGQIGAFVATLAVSIPSFIFVLLFSSHEETIAKNHFFTTFLTLVTYVSVGLIFSVTLNLLLSTPLILHTARHLTTSPSIGGTLLFLFGSLFLYYRYQLNPLFITLLSGIIGGILYYL